MQLHQLSPIPPEVMTIGLMICTTMLCRMILSFANLL
jgi:hypothetical protein